MKKVIYIIIAFLFIGCNEKSILHENLDMGFAFQKYTSYAEYLEELQTIKETYSNKFDYFKVGNTYKNDYDLYALTIGDTTKPAIFIVSTLHAKEEWYGVHYILHFLKKLLDPADNQATFNDQFLENFCIVSIPMVNVWGYYASKNGKHYNRNKQNVKGIESADWHDMTNYSTYLGVNLNRNFDFNWEEYPNLPWSVKSYWNGTDYGRANYFMMPYCIINSDTMYIPEDTCKNRILMPDTTIYDFKGEKPFSEPETQAIKKTFERYKVFGFIDSHNMMPFHKHNTSIYTEELQKELIINAIDRLNSRHENILPKTKFTFISDYDNNGPFAANWAYQKKNVHVWAWEMGIDYPKEIWTDAYMEMLYTGLYYFMICK